MEIQEGGEDERTEISASVVGHQNHNAVDQDAGGADGATHCATHPYRSGVPPGGICAFCLQEKLGELVISSPFPVHSRATAAASSSPSPPSRSGGTSSSLSLAVVRSTGNSSVGGSILPFLLAKKQKQNQIARGGSAAADRTAEIVFRRSKSTANPVNRDRYRSDYSPRKRGGFWSFLHLSSSSSSSSKPQINNNNNNMKQRVDCNVQTSQTENGSSSSRRDQGQGSRSSNLISGVDEDGISPSGGQASSSSSSSSCLDQRKVSRSRSVGCGSRSFSGDFFERISNGFGDCTLRRVESQREGKSRSHNTSRNKEGRGERVRYCGGIFGGFTMMTSSSSSWTSSSTSSASSSDQRHLHGRTNGVRPRGEHGRSRSWGWAFASPIKALSGGYYKPCASNSHVPKDARRCRMVRDGVHGMSPNGSVANVASVPSLRT